MKLARILILAAAVAALPLAARAAGGHDGVGCNGCHGIHTAKGDLSFAVAPNKVAVNPRTKQPYSGSTALCLGCHEETSKGGQGYLPVGGHLNHPYNLASVNPKVAKVPAELLREGKFECVSCHDPHPSNPNAKYLRVDTKAASMDAFCAVCHSAKADSGVVAKSAGIFSSMDQSAARAAAPAPTAEPKPAAAKKK
jgi:predicted CXXCH cytochrome family protein